MTATETTTLRQSRIGKRPVAIPAGVTVSIKGTTVGLKGPKGQSERTFAPGLNIKNENGAISVVVTPELGDDGARLQGLTWALIKNMVEGVSKGYALSLDLYGTGYRAELTGQNLTLALGLSHPVKLTLPAGIKGKVETIDEAGTKRPRLHLESHDKELLGQVAAKIRSFRPPEPYKGKGVRYTGERIRQKAGKAGAKGKK